MDAATAPTRKGKTRQQFAEEVNQFMRQASVDAQEAFIASLFDRSTRRQSAFDSVAPGLSEDETLALLIAMTPIQAPFRRKPKAKATFALDTAATVHPAYAARLRTA
jgi:hypothetical protein